MTSVSSWPSSTSIWASCDTKCHWPQESTNSFAQPNCSLPSCTYIVYIYIYIHTYTHTLILLYNMYTHTCTYMVYYTWIWKINLWIILETTVKLASLRFMFPDHETILIRQDIGILTSRASSLLHKPGQGPSEATITRKAHSRRCFSCPRITSTRWLLESFQKIADSKIPRTGWGLILQTRFGWQKLVKQFQDVHQVATFWRCFMTQTWNINAPQPRRTRTSPFFRHLIWFHLNRARMTWWRLSDLAQVFPKIGVKPRKMDGLFHGSKPY